MVLGYYKNQDIEGMVAKFQELETQHQTLRESILMHTYSTPKGDEFAKHGFQRRCDMLWRCLRKTFEEIPPNLDGKPTRDQTADVSILLHCFFIHVFGACDDLAWILVHEKGITKPDGSELPLSHVGIRKKNKTVRDQLSGNMIATLDELEHWFEHVEEFRHSLAHRIPLYVPPYQIQHDKADDYNRLERESLEALRRKDLDKHERLEKEQEELTFFRPWLTHSFSENAPIAVIHPQLLGDFGAILKLGEITFREL